MGSPSAHKFASELNKFMRSHKHYMHGQRGHINYLSNWFGLNYKYIESLILVLVALKTLL